MSVDPTIRAASPTAPPSHYLAYLNSPGWRTRRQRALENSGFRCFRCAGKRGLQVHHKSYARLGAEWDQDLEVLCENCHRDEHLQNPDQTSLGVYLKLASSLIGERPYTSVADLAEDMRRRCIRHKIPMNVERINDAIAVVCGNRLTDPRQRKHDLKYAHIPEHDRPISAAEARETLALLGITTLTAVLTKPMPKVEKTPGEQQAHEDNIHAQVKREQAEQYRKERGRDRQPFEERVEAIFAEKQP